MQETAIFPVTGNKTSLSTDTGFLKLLAALLMLIDHIGCIFWPQLPLLRIIGRLAFPLFAYCAALGCSYTHNIKRYLSRLLGYAALSQLPWMFAFTGGEFRFNVLFTLSLGTVAIYGLQSKKEWLTPAALLAAALLPVEYGFPGVLLMAAFYLLRYHPVLLCSSAFAILFFLFPSGATMFSLGETEIGIQQLAALAFPLLFLNPNIGRYVNKRFFYWFYPAHLLILGIIHFAFPS